MAQTFDVQQNIFKDTFPSIQVISMQENALNELILNRFLQTVDGGAIGLAPVYGSERILVSLAISTSLQVLIIRFTGTSTPKVKPSKRSKQKGSKPNLLGRDLLRKRVLCNRKLCKYTFRMDRLCSALYLDLDVRICNAVDMLSEVTDDTDRLSLEAFRHALGGNEAFLNMTGVKAVFRNDEHFSAPLSEIALQAWAACKAATFPFMKGKFAKVARIHTQGFSKEHLTLSCKTTRDADRRVALKPTIVKNDVEAEFSLKNGTLKVQSARFPTRLRESSNQTLKIETDHRTMMGRVTKVAGRASTIELGDTFNGSAIHSILTIGRGNPTAAESGRTSVVLSAFQRTNSLLKSPFIRKIWFPAEVATLSGPSFGPVPLSFDKKPPNPSQMKAINAILSPKDSDALTVIHGPPGTGKTTVIAAAVVSITQAAPNRAIWLVAQSNVAVKNIAEKLAEVDFLQFKILVSKDFHDDWHEHLYEKIGRNLIRSDRFPKEIVSAERQLVGSRVILCTLSTMSNDRIAFYSRLAPVETVIIDEASQIEVGDYVHMISRFEQSMRKLVFIGDPQQLAPHDHEEIRDLQSVFEKPHLRENAILLDTQYRMPVPVGNFISREVYGGKLKTVHSITSPKCCQFVDIFKGVEEKANKSWKNDAEADAVIRFARKYTKECKSFRIITPYDKQRTLLENRLKTANLPWEDKCFNVDSFQGNEDEHIIVSLVRSQKIGFLENMRRTNVMLTRFKKSMVICTSRNFVHQIAKETLVGKLAEKLGAKAWLTLPPIA